MTDFNKYNYTHVVTDDTKEIGGFSLAHSEILYLEDRLGWKLGVAGIERANQLKQLGATLDEIAEAIALL